MKIELTIGKKIEVRGSIMLVITIILTKILISTPSLYVKQSASAGWIEVLISGIFEVFILAIVLKLLFHFPGKDIIDIGRASFGTIGQALVGVVSSLIFVISSAAVFRCFGELIRNTVIREISYENVALFLLVATITAAYLGLETQITVSNLIFPFIMGALIVVLFINLSRYSVTNILPVMGNGFTHTLSNALLKNASFYEIGMILFLPPYLRDFHSVKKISFTALIFSVLLASIITLFYQLSVPCEVAGTFALPLYQMTRMIKAGTFFQRIEPLNVFIWGGAMFIYIGVGIRMASHSFKKAFSLTEEKPLVYIFAMIICFIALIPGSETSVERIYDFLMVYSYIAYPVLPLIFLILAFACSKGEERSSAS